MNTEQLWEETRQNLEDSGAAISVAEYHGHLIGRHVGGHEISGNLVVPMVSELTGAARDQIQADAEIWSDLVARYFHAFETEHYGFQPLLPGDNLPLTERLDGLALWSTGFLNGIGCALNENQASGLLENDETIADLIEISQLDTSAEETEENEALFAEVVEFVRLAVLDLNEQLKEKLSAERDDSEALH